MTVLALLTPAMILWAVRRPLRAALAPRFAVAYPDLAPKLRLAIGVAAMPVLATYLFWPNLLWLLTAGAALFIVLEGWRARPSWGRRRGLPPGSLGIFPATWADDRYYLRQSQNHGPIFKTSNFLRPTVCVVGLEPGIRILTEHADKLETPRLPFAEFVPGGMLRYMPEPQHQRYRAIFGQALKPTLIQQFESAFVTIIKRTLDDISVKSCASENGINPLPCLDNMMMELWLLLFFAIGRDSAESERLLTLYPIIDITNPTKASSRQIRQAVNCIKEMVEQQPANWRETVPPCLLSAILADNPANAKDPVVIGNLIYLLTTTRADMSALLCWIMKNACDHSEWLECIACAPAGDSPPLSLAERFVMETLRMRQSEFLYRTVIREFSYGGFRIPKGWLLRICVWESHRDPAVFEQPDRFNPDRFIDRSYKRSEYSPFGASTRACLAPYLVTFVARIFVSELAAGFTLGSRAFGPIELASSRHWAPGSSFRVQMQRHT